MSLKSVKKTVNIESLHSNLNVNVREHDDYALEQMKESIVAAGKILKPLQVEELADKKGEYLVLQGNRRTLAAQELFNDPHCPSDLKEALKKLDVIVYTELLPPEKEGLIMDHGGEKPLGRTSTVRSVWRLDKAFYSPSQIANVLYFSLADYTGNKKKLAEVPSDPKAREKYLNGWFRGTLGGYILSAAKMGEFVREQFILTARSEDRLLKEGEHLIMRCSRDRITQLSAAITADTMKSSGDWSELTIKEEPDGENVKRTFIGGGPKFNELIAKFITEDVSGKTDDGNKRPSIKTLAEKAAHYKSIAVKTAFAIASGEDVQNNGMKLLEFDDAFHTLTMKCEVLQKELPNVKDPNVAALIASILKGVVGGVQESLKPFVA